MQRRLLHLLDEIRIQSTRSGGKGGQHVNKVSSKTELIFDVPKSAVLSSEEKYLITTKLKSRMSGTGILRIDCDESRSQHRNRELIKIKFMAMIKAALKKKAKRIATKPAKAVAAKRVEVKKKRGTIKKLRGRKRHISDFSED